MRQENEILRLVEEHRLGWLEMWNDYSQTA